MVCRNMKNIDIKYSDIQTLMSEYRNNIGKNLNQFSTLMNDINALVGDKVDFCRTGSRKYQNYYAGSSDTTCGNNGSNAGNAVKWQYKRRI